MKNWLMFCLCLLIQQTTLASEQTINETSSHQENYSAWDYAKAFLILEAAIALSSATASDDPKAYGGILAVMGPAVSPEDTSDSEFWAGVVAVEAIALYNISISDENLSSSRIMEKNIVAWHCAALIFLGVGYVSEKLFQDDSLTFTPESDGGKLNFSFEF